MITNCYYLTGCAKNADNEEQYGIGGYSDVFIESATAEEFASGKVAYLLNSKVESGPVWYQNLSGQSADATPVLNKKHGIVYASQPCASRFSNRTLSSETHTCINVFCSKCGGYEEPSLVDGWYEIDNAGKLYWFSDAVNFGDDQTKICGKLTADIIVNDNVLKADGSINGTPSRSWKAHCSAYNGSFESVCLRHRY